MVRPDDYRNFLHAMEDGFCMVQLLCEADETAVDYVFLEMNGSYERQTGLQGAQGRRMHEVAPAHGERWLEMFRQISQTGESRRFDFASPQGDHWYEGRAYRLGSTQPPTIAIVTHDVTEHRRREQELADMARTLEQGVALRQEVARYQEQLRAMATEMTFAEQRERKRLATELRDDLGERLLLTRLKLGQIQQRAMLDASTEELLQEADKVLTRALAYTHTVVADLSPLVLQDLGLPSAVKWLAERMQQHGLAVTVQTALPDDLTVPEAQAVFLFQSVRELLMNVLKHAACRGASVHMTMAAGQLQIDVRDEGIGFAGEPADSPRPPHVGLFSIRERITALGGTFHIDSRPQVGTTVTLKLPLGPAAVEEGRRSEGEAGEGASSQVRPTSGGIIRVLLVDDHAMVRQGLRSVLDAYADMKVVGEAANGEAAVRLAGELLPTVVLMDINMPGCNGIEATRRIKAQYPDMSVIGLSVDADGHNQEEMLQAGAYSLMTKEAAVEQLYSLIYEAVKPGVIPFPPLRL